jgi:hypothetical protein
MRAEVPRSFGFEPEGWCCQQIVQTKAASDGERGVRGYVVSSETGELGESVLMKLSREEEHASVEGEGGLCIAQRRRIVSEGMMR